MAQKVQIDVDGFFNFEVYEDRGIARIYCFQTYTMRIVRDDAPRSFALMKELITALSEEKEGLEKEVREKRKKYNEMEPPTKTPSVYNKYEDHESPVL